MRMRRTVLILVCYQLLSKPNASTNITEKNPWLCHDLLQVWLKWYNAGRLRLREKRYICLLSVTANCNWVKNSKSPVGWGYRRHRLHLSRGVRPPPRCVLIYDTKQSDGEAPAQELWGTWSTPLLLLLSGALWLGVVAPHRVLMYG